MNQGLKGKKLLQKVKGIKMAERLKVASEEEKRRKTSDLIPLCHPLALTRVAFEFTIEEADASIMCNAQVETYGKTGVEMEALTAVQVGLLTIYDMCKAVDRGMVMSDIRVMEKQGGKSGHWKVE